MRNLRLLILVLNACLVLSAQAQSSQLYRNVPFEKANIANVTVINSSRLDFAPAFYKDGIVFVSNMDIAGKSKVYDKHIKQQTMSLFMSQKNQKGVLQKPEPFALELVTTVHEGPLTFSKDFKTVYFSRNNNKNSGKAKYVELIDRMQIYEAHLTDKGWNKPERVVFDRETKDFCHPALSQDGQKLYFSSNRKGGFGGMDLYVSNILPNGKMDAPVNLGPTINSDKNEVFPFIHRDGTLYFSSNKLGGTGGLDIYYTHRMEHHDVVGKADSEAFDTPLSIGAPFNSEKDDFSFILDTERKSGYFSSNRNGGFGEDDIYSFALADEINPKPIIEQMIILTVLDRQTQKPIANADVSLLLEEGGSKGTQIFYTNESGHVVLKRNRVYDYEVKINKTKYDSEQFALSKNDSRPEIIVLLDAAIEEKFAEVSIQVLDRDTRKPIEKANVNWQSKNNVLTENRGIALLKLDRNIDNNLKILKENYYTESITYTKEDGRTTITVLMRQSKAIATTESATSANASANPASILVEKPITTIANTEFYQLNNIYYDFDKAFVRNDASKTLDSVIVLLNKFPNMMIELEGHTDSRGANRYNDNLSDRRTVNAAQYLIKHGINRQRIKRVVRGELMLTNDCGDDIPCAEIDHQANRRTVVRIVKYGRASGNLFEAK